MRLLLAKVTIGQRISVVIAIASLFLILELVVGFITGALVLIADAFHILSDIIGYVVALVAVRYAGQSTNKVPEQYTLGFRRAEVLGAFFNGAFLSALGVSVFLQSIERFIEPSGITNPVLIMAVGAGGIGSNFLMLLALGGHAHGGHSHGGHSHSGHSQGSHAPNGHSQNVSNDQDDQRRNADSDGSVLTSNTTNHANHAHTLHLAAKKGKPSRFADLNILGVLLHILGDAINSAAVIVSAGIFMATGFVYTDPIASVFVGLMILGTAIPLLIRSGQNLLASGAQFLWDSTPTPPSPNDRFKSAGGDCGSAKGRELGAVLSICRGFGSDLFTIHHLA